MFYRFRKSYNDMLRRLLGDWRFFLYDERRHERDIVRRHYGDTCPVAPSGKTIIYMANGFCDHAGLSDRFKGMTTLYGWSRELSVDFRILHTHPFNLGDYLAPNRYNWQMDAGEACYDKAHATVNYLMLHPLVKKYIDSGEIAALEHEWFVGRVGATQKAQLHFYTNMIPESDRLFADRFHELFKPSTRVAAELKRHKEAIGGDYISVSFRFVQLLGDFTDCEGDTLTPPQQDDLVSRSLQVLRHIKERTPGIDHILVTADSIRFLQAARQLPYVYVIDGKVGHINFENSDEVNMKTFLDFLAIADARKCYLAKSGKMYNSDFARRAAMVGGRPFEIFTY